MACKGKGDRKQIDFSVLPSNGTWWKPEDDEFRLEHAEKYGFWDLTDCGDYRFYLFRAPPSDLIGRYLSMKPEPNRKRELLYDKDTSFNVMSYVPRPITRMDLMTMDERRRLPPNL